MYPKYILSDSTYVTIIITVDRKALRLSLGSIFVGDTTPKEWAMEAKIDKEIVLP